MAAVTLIRGSARATAFKPSAVVCARSLKYELKPKPTKPPLAVPRIPQADHIDTDQELPDMHMMTASQKMEMDCDLLGIEDPYNLEPVRRHWGTKEDPVLVPSRFNHRMVCCVCDGDTVSYQMFYRGGAQRCACGQFFKLFPVKRLFKVDPEPYDPAHH